jgi:hypothetical protein
MHLKSGRALHFLPDALLFGADRSPSTMSGSSTLPFALLKVQMSVILTCSLTERPILKVKLPLNEAWNDQLSKVEFITGLWSPARAICCGGGDKVCVVSDDNCARVRA